MYTYPAAFWVITLIPAARAKTALVAGIKMIRRNAVL